MAELCLNVEISFEVDIHQYPMKKVYLSMPWNLPEHQKAVDIKITHVNQMVMSHLSALTALYQYFSRESRGSHITI